MFGEHEKAILYARALIDLNRLWSSVFDDPHHHHQQKLTKGMLFERTVLISQIHFQRLHAKSQ